MDEPNDLAFFYLYDYTRSYRPRHPPQRTSSTVLHHLDNAATRRSLHLEATKTRLANHHKNIQQVLSQPPSSDSRLRSLADRMARVDSNRSRILRLTAETCGRKVALAKSRAEKVKVAREREAQVASNGILERLKEAEKRRGEYLAVRGRRLSGGQYSPSKRAEAATKIQRAWRQYRVGRAVTEFRAQGVSVQSVTDKGFELCVGKFKARETVKVTGRLLLVLGMVVDVGEKEVDSFVRMFLSAYMILGHTDQVLHTPEQTLETVPRTSDDANRRT
jgi:hypothetical protein